MPEGEGESVLATYAFRMNVFTPERHYVLTRSSLMWVDGEARPKAFVSRLSLDDIVALKLRYAPSRFQLARCTAQLVLRKGGSLMIASGHYIGIGEFEDRTDTYEGFVRALAAAIAQRNPQGIAQATFPRGYERSSLLLGALLGVTGLVFFIMLLPVMFAVGLTAIIPLAILLVFGVPAAVSEIRRNWPGFYDPHDIPGDLLPSTKTPPYVDPALAKIIYALMRR